MIEEWNRLLGRSDVVVALHPGRTGGRLLLADGLVPGMQDQPGSGRQED